MSAASTILADLARLLRSHGYRVSPLAKSAAAVGNPCPTCGHKREPSVRDRLLGLAAAGEVTAKLLVEAAQCARGTADNELCLAKQSGASPLAKRFVGTRQRGCAQKGRSSVSARSSSLRATREAEAAADALIAALRPLIEGAARAARARRALRPRREVEVLGAPDDLDIDWQDRGCTCFVRAPCAWCLDPERAEVSL